MKQHLNTLFITTDGAYLAREGQAVLVRHEKQTKIRLPIHTIGSIVCLGRVGVSPSLAALCGEQGVSISLCSSHGRFLARISGFTSGNVLLRREQYRRADDVAASAAIARAIVAGKIANCRQVLLRGARDHPDTPGTSSLQEAADKLAQSLRLLSDDMDLDAIRGMEGDAANAYFATFDHLITNRDGRFVFTRRSRRPPMDNVNAMLSFIYAMLAHDVRSACESVGLDPAVGFLHRDRPGRPGLALDLMEELRPFLADRLVLSLINRQQVDPAGFTTDQTGGVRMSDATRKALLVAYQKRKQDTIEHPFLLEKVTIGLLPHIQARLLARHLRKDLDAYPPFIWR
jgi:CRISPR-associated protein Cas1